MSGKKINFIVQSQMWRHPQEDAKKNQNVYPVDNKFLYKKDELKSFEYIKIGKNKEKDIKNLRSSSIHIFSIPEEQIKVEEWTQSRKVYNALSFGDNVVIDKPKKKDIIFFYNSCKYPSPFDNYLTFGGMVGVTIKTVGEEWVFPAGIKKIIISFPSREERDKKYREFENKTHCVVEGVDWEKLQIGSEDLKIVEFSKIGGTFTEAEKTTSTPEKKPETNTAEETNTIETEETGNTPEPETTGTPEQNTAPPPKSISVYDYFEKKLATEDKNLWILVNQYVPGNSKDEKEMLFLSLIKSGLVNEDHVDNQRKFIKYRFLKSKLEEIYPQKQDSWDGNPPSGDRLSQTRKNAIQTITAALNLELVVKESELSSEFHGWKEKINNLNKDEIINDFVEKMLSAIGGKRREKQTSQRVNDNVNDMKNKTGEQLNEKINKNDEAFNTKTYQEKKEEIKTQKIRSALEDPDKYRRNVAIPGIENQMVKNDIKEAELDDNIKKDWEKLKNGEIQGEEIVEKETKIKQSIGQQGAKKKVNFFRNEVETVLKSGKKERIRKLKMQMIEFINADNIFYESKKNEVRSLLSRLIINKQQNNNSPEKFPWKVVVPVSLLAVILIITALVVIRKRARISRITKTTAK